MIRTGGGPFPSSRRCREWHPNACMGDGRSGSLQKFGLVGAIYSLMLGRVCLVQPANQLRQIRRHDNEESRLTWTRVPERVRDPGGNKDCGASLNDDLLFCQTEPQSARDHVPRLIVSMMHVKARDLGCHAGRRMVTEGQCRPSDPGSAFA